MLPENGFRQHETRKNMSKFTLLIVLAVFLSSCASTPGAGQMQMYGEIKGGVETSMSH